MGSPKPQAACTLQAADGMDVRTSLTSSVAAEAQNATLEFILVNHPLDCPVCDKGGECPLQDLTFRYGPPVTRMVIPKRTLEKPVPISPLIKLEESPFYPEGGEQRGDHVLYAGRIGREKGVFELLEAAALSAEPWPLWLMGTGSAAKVVEAQIRRLGLGDRVKLSSPVARIAVPEGVGGEVVAGPLVDGGELVGVLVVASAHADRAALVQPVLEPFAMALANDRRLSERARLREAA